MNRIPLADAANKARAGARGTSDWIERLARVGLAAKGIVYVLVGLLAAQAAFGGSSATGSSGALQRVQDEWWGMALLAAIAAGLVGYAIWRIVAAIFNPENDRAGRRGFFLISGLLYGGLAVEAGRLALGGGSGGGGDRASHWTAEIMSQPFGIWLVGVAGAIAGASALYQIYRAWTVDIDERLAIVSLSQSAHRWVIGIGRAGIAARGVVLGIIGWFLINAALQSNPAEARGLGGALRALQDQPFGPYLLVAVAAGLVAYGFHQLVKARYRVIRTPG